MNNKENRGYSHADTLKLDVKESDEFEENATVRVKLSYEICKLMCYEGEAKDLDENEQDI